MKLRHLALTRRHRWWGAGAAVVLLVGTVVYLQSSDDHVEVSTASDVASTTEATRTSTTTVTTTATTEVPPTTEPPTTEPPTTATPTTTAPPAGPLEMTAVLSYAKARPASSWPQTTTGANVCPAEVERPSDAGDDTVRDIGSWYLARYCDGVYRGVLATQSDTPALQAAWLRLDVGTGGCEGTDRVIIGWHTAGPGGGTSGRGAVVATPSCDESSWTLVDGAGFPVFSGAWLQLDFRETAIGSPSAFDWRGYVQAVGETGSAIDVVPNEGPEHFVL